MLNRLHNKLGTAGLVVAVVALVAAVAGTAFAAGGLTKKQEKQVVKIAKKYAGQPGAPGAVGPQGPKGDQGIQGIQGPPGPTETVLPSGKTETGVWAFGRLTGVTRAFVPISYPLRIADFSTEINDIVWIGVGEAGSQEPVERGCSGTADEPTAAKGKLCIYAGELNGLEAGFPEFSSAGFGAKAKGLILEFQTNPAQEASGFGSWAMTVG